MSLKKRKLAGPNYDVAISELSVCSRVRTKKKFFKGDEKSAYALLLLPILWWGVFFVYAFIRAFYFSFTDLSLDVSSITKFFTFDQYARMFTDATFWAALKNTLIWTIAMTLANNILGLIVAYLITKMKRGQKLFLTLLFWPTLVSAVASTEITKMVFSPSSTGLMNRIIILFGGSPLKWYNDANLALLSLMIIPLLFGFTSQMMIYYVAIKGVDKSQIEAAKMDGARGGTIFKSIYVPAIMKAINYNVILSIIAGVRVISPMQLLADNPASAGGPLNSTMSIVLYLYQNTLGNEMAYACAIGVFTTVIILLLSLLQNKITSKEGL